jgi:hypothetical protein
VREEFAGGECECYDRGSVDPHEDGCPAAEEPDYDGSRTTSSSSRATRSATDTRARGR